MRKRLPLRGITLTTLIVLFLTIARILYVGTEVVPTTVRVVPSEIIIKEENGLLDKMFTVRVTVDNVVDLYGWQIKLFFDPTIVNSTKDFVSYSPGHVFAGKRFIAVEPVVRKGEDDAYVFFGAVLLAEEPSFNGSGVLCLINFTGIEEGVSTLRFSKPLGEDTILRDSDWKNIPFMIADAMPSSEITIDLEPTETIKGRDIEIHGAITPIVADVEVTIHSRVADGIWDTLTTVRTDLESHYSFLWMPTEEGTYDIRASWLGDENINPAISETKTVTVQARLDVGPYLFTGIVIMILIVMYVATRKTNQSVARPTEYP